jgi:hypothetical protein
MIQDNANEAENNDNIEAGASNAEADKPKVTIEFPYSEILREKVPKAFDLAEKVATDWKHEGDFTDLGIGHPLADIAASQALQKAKDIEKKLEEKGVFSMAKLGLAIAKAQVETVKNKLNNKPNKSE